MRHILTSNRALSEIVAYVLLIAIAISISGMVYVWMKSHITTNEGPSCPEEISLIISNYSCSGNELNLTLQNKGFFTVNGFSLKTNNREGSTFGVDNLDNNGVKINISQSVFMNYTLQGPVKLIEVQPYIINKTRVYCNSIVQNIQC